MKRQLSILLFVLYVISSMADGDSLKHWGGSFSVMPGRAVVIDKWQKKWQKGTKNWAIDIKVTRATLPSDSDGFARDYGFPTLSVGLRWSFNHGVIVHKGVEFWGEQENVLKEVDYDSHMGNILSFYGQFTRPFLRTPQWEVDYTIDMGVAWSPSAYNKIDNIDNELIGSRMLIFFGAGLHAMYHFSHPWGVKMGVDFYHHSNGALDRPNKGANIVAPSLGLVYQPYYDGAMQKQHDVRNSFKKYWYVNLSTSIGARTLMEEWQLTQFYTTPGEADYRTANFKHYLAFAASADVIYRYACRWASGLGFDLFYGNYDKRLKEISLARGYDETVSPWSLGVAAKHETFYHNLSLNVSLGFYLYRKMGTWTKELEKPYYERIGLNYGFPKLNGLKIGINVKAHRFKADLTELLVSYPIVFFTNKGQ